MVGAGEHIGQERLEEGIRGSQSELVVGAGAARGLEVESGRAGGLTAIKFGVDVAQVKAVAPPMDFAGYLGHGEFPPMKFAAVENIEAEIGNLFAVNGQDTLPA